VSNIAQEKSEAYYLEFKWRLMERNDEIFCTFCWFLINCNKKLNSKQHIATEAIKL
jgi:hypothetical protein